MPSTNTITAFNIFVAGKKARASQVNTNFSVFRGNILPVNTDTASASDLTHNLGSETHRWKDAYVKTIDFESSTTTASLIFEGDTSNTAGSLDLKIGGVTVGSWGASGMKYTSNRVPTVTKISTSTGGSVGAGNIGQWLFSGSIGHPAMLTGTSQTLGGSFLLNQGGRGAVHIRGSVNLKMSAYTSSAENFGAQIQLRRYLPGTTSSQVILSYVHQENRVAGTVHGPVFEAASSFPFYAIDSSCTVAGEVTYELMLGGSTINDVAGTAGSGSPPSITGSVNLYFHEE